MLRTAPLRARAVRGRVDRPLSGKVDVTELDLSPSLREVQAADEPAPAHARPLTREEAQARVRRMVDEHFDRVWRFLRRLGLPDDAADDASQEVFTIAARKVDVIREDGEAQYLIGIAANVAAESKRGFARRQELAASQSPLSEPAPAPDELLDQKRAREALDAVIASMPMDLRVSFVAFEMEGMSAPEIARMLDVPLGTVASRVRRGREHFRAAAERIQHARRRP